MNLEQLYQPITVDLWNPYPLPKMHVQQNNIGRVALVTLTAGGTVVDPSSYSVTAWATKPDMTVSYAMCEVTNGKVALGFTSQMLAVPGELKVEIRLIADGVDISTPIFIVCVGKSNISNSAIESQDEFTVFQQVLNEVNQLSKEIDNISGGQPTVVSLVSDMTDTNTIYLYAGTEEGYTSGNWYYHDGSAWVSGGLYGGESGLSYAEKSLILTLFQNAVYSSDQSGNVEALYNLFFNTTVAVTGIELSETALSIDSANAITLVATLKPSGATGIVVWESSDDSVAIVTQTGMVTPVGSGSCVITASVDESISASCNVNVDLSSVIDVTQDGSTLTIVKVPNVTQEDSTLIIE